MKIDTSALLPGTILYPDSDGKPMSDNTRQAQWIVVLYDNLRARFANDPNVFVAADNLWYPVEGEPRVRIGPDVYVVFGRPKGHRGSYKQWEENDIPLTVVFEILSPGNTQQEMDEKLLFYEQHGVEEYYVYDPDENRLMVYRRGREALVRVREVEGYVSPRLGIRFEMTQPEMTVYHPSGERFQLYEEIVAARDAERQRAQVAEYRAEFAEQRAEFAEQRAEQAEERARRAEERSRRLAELSRRARRGQATAEELAELERLEEESPS